MIIISPDTAIAQILSDLNICSVDLNVLEQALALNFEDFEDAVQYACAVVHNLDAIVTRDLPEFDITEIAKIFVQLGLRGFMIGFLLRLIENILNKQSIKLAVRRSLALRGRGLLSLTEIS